MSSCVRNKQRSVKRRRRRRGRGRRRRRRGRGRRRRRRGRRRRSLQSMIWLSRTVGPVVSNP